MTGLEKLHTLATGLHQGTLALDPETARHYVNLFAGVADDLEAMLDKISHAPRGEGFGPLHSGRVVADKYHDKLAGDTNSLAASLAHHVAVVRGMHLALKRTVDTVESTDHANARTYTPGG